MFVILVLIFLTFGLIFMLKKSFGKLLPLSLMIIPLILYISQFIFHTFKIGIYLILILSLLGLIGTIYKLIKKDVNFRQNIFSAGFWTFLIICFLIYLTDFGQQFSLWDELAHWGMMVKEMLRLDNFYAVVESQMVWHKDYPPFISLFQYFWCRILGYSEQTMNISLHVYMFSLIVPYLVDKFKRKINVIILPLLSLLVILMIDPYQTFKSIQTDILIAVMTTYSLVLVFFEKESLLKKVLLTLSLIALLLTKQIGLPLFLMVIVSYIFNLIIKDKQILKNKKFYLSIIIMALIPLGLYKIWGLYTTKLNTGAQFFLGNINVGEYLNLLFKHQGESYKLAALDLFKQYLFTESVIVKPFKIGYIYAYFLAIILLVLLYLCHKKDFPLKKLFLLIFIFTCGTFGYALVISILYMFCFSVEETLSLACFGRYMGSLVLLEYLFILYLYCFLKSKDKNYNWQSLLLGILLLIGVNTNLKCLLPQKYFGDNFIEFKEIAQTIKDHTETNSKVYIVMQDYSYNYLLPYFLDSRIMEHEYCYLYDNVNEYDKEKVLDVILKQDYVYLNDINADFIKEYQKIFTSEITENTLYKVNKDQAKLEKI